MQFSKWKIGAVALVCMLLPGSVHAQIVKNERCRSYFPFTELHHVCLFKVIDICYLEICKTYVVLPHQ